MKLTHKIYVAQRGARFTNDDAQLIGRELEKLGDYVNPSDVVDLARNKNSALHKFFEWDTQVAAKKHRLSQARRILSFIRVVVSKDGKKVPVKTFYGVKGLASAVTGKTGDKVYARIEVVRDSKVLKEHIIRQGLKKLRQFQKNYVLQKEYFEKVYEAIEGLERNG